MTAKAAKIRCTWAENDPLMREYHDKEWGNPVRDSRTLWELLMLEGFQAGLAWIIVLRKRDAFRKAFKNFDPAKVARFKEADIERLLRIPASFARAPKFKPPFRAPASFSKCRKPGKTSPRSSGTWSAVSPS